MNSLFRLNFAATLAAVLSSTFAGFAADPKLERLFPYVIQQDLGSAEFAPGDQITITSVRGDRRHIEPGGNYLVEGHYTLASADGAKLSLFCTTRGPSGATPIQETQQTAITKGSGNFELREELSDDGWLHVSFYVNGYSHGGVYFGEKGRDETVLRKKGWSDFTAEPSAGDPANGANRALLAYLGNPVPAPADLDPRYRKENLARAFRAMSEKAGWTVKELDVDDSEFPFLVYGLLAGKHTLEVAQFDADGGYPYGGSVRGSTVKDSTCFAVNMTPASQFPDDAAETCHRRLMIRMQMLENKAMKSAE